MKTKIYFFIGLIGFSSFSLNAQLRVLPNGRIQIGTLRIENEDLENVTTMQVFGPHGDMRCGSKVAFGDFGRFNHQGWNCFVGEYGATDTDQLWLHGKLGIYLTTNGYANNVVAYYNPASNSYFVFNTNLRVNGINITSDARLKENVKSLEDPLNILNQIDGVTYNYKLSEIKKNRQQNEKKFEQLSHNDPMPISENVSDSESAQKSAKDKLLFSEIESLEIKEASKKRIGFLAQDIQKVLPELVETDENGVLSIDYIGFIPIIVESIKEMQNTIIEQKQQITQLQTLLIENENPQLRSASTYPEEPNTSDDAKLYERYGASVNYRLPKNFTSASLHIYDISGNIIKKINLDKNNNFIDINKSEVGYGTFVYVLLINGEKRDSIKKNLSK